MKPRVQISLVKRKKNGKRKGKTYYCMSHAIRPSKIYANVEKKKIDLSNRPKEKIEDLICVRGNKKDFHVIPPFKRKNLLGT